MTNSSKLQYSFGPFLLDPEEGRLLRDGEPISLEPKVFLTLVLLVEKSGHLLKKDELMEQVWSDTVVEEGSLTRNISTLRRVLGEGYNGSQVIETLPKRGYRFAVPVRVVANESSNGSGITEEQQENKNSATSIGRQAALEADETEKKQSELSVKPWLEWLRRPMITISLIFLGVLTLSIGVYFGLRSRPRDQIDSIAVLPFRYQGEPDDKYLGLGLTKTIIDSLTQIRDLKVLPYTSVSSYQDTIDVVAAANQLGTRAALSGEIIKTENTLTVSVELTDGIKGLALWRHTYIGTTGEVLQIQTAILQDISARLRPGSPGSTQQRQATKQYTENREAYDFYLRGRAALETRTVEGINEAIKYFKQATDADPHYALAYAGLADVFRISGVFYTSTNPAYYMVNAKGYALKAIEIDESLSEAHTSLGSVMWWYDWDWDGSEKELKRAIELNPNSATAHLFYSLLLATTGRVDSGLAEIVRAEQLEPKSLMINTIHGWILYFARRTDESIAQFLKVREMDPTFPRGRIALAQAYLDQGKEDEAAKLYLTVRDSDLAKELGRAYKAHGLKGLWERQIEIEKSSNDYVSPMSIADNYVHLGQKDQALDYLEKAFEVHDGWLLFIKPSPRYDMLRSEPRFINLLRKMKLGQ
jgi:DNA-binding winged helix-turn-helix (wHTH) protein/TolB-like protein